MKSSLDARLEFYERVEDEYGKAETKHPSWPSDVVHASAIINKEAGKLTQACIDATYANVLTDEAIARMRMFASRIGAMALRFDEGLNQ